MTTRAAHLIILSILGLIVLAVLSYTTVFVVREAHHQSRCERAGGVWIAHHCLDRGVLVHRSTKLRFVHRAPIASTNGVPSTP